MEQVFCSMQLDLGWAGEMDIWWSGGQVKLASVVLLNVVITSNKKQFKKLKTQDCMISKQ